MRSASDRGVVSLSSVVVGMVIAGLAMNTVVQLVRLAQHMMESVSPQAGVVDDEVQRLAEVWARTTAATVRLDVCTNPPLAERRSACAAPTTTAAGVAGPYQLPPDFVGRTATPPPHTGTWDLLADWAQQNHEIAHICWIVDGRSSTPIVGWGATPVPTTSTVPAAQLDQRHLECWRHVCTTWHTAPPNTQQLAPNGRWLCVDGRVERARWYPTNLPDSEWDAATPSRLAAHDLYQPSWWANPQTATTTGDPVWTGAQVVATHIAAVDWVFDGAPHDLTDPPGTGLLELQEYNQRPVGTGQSVMSLAVRSGHDYDAYRRWFGRHAAPPHSWQTVELRIRPASQCAQFRLLDVSQPVVYDPDWLAVRRCAVLWDAVTPPVSI